MSAYVPVLFVAFIIHVLACDPGTFKAPDSSCQPCPSGTFMPNDNATACWTCPINSDPNANATHCICRHGTVWNTTDRYCHFCPAGSYFKEHEGLRSCALCPKDTYQPNRGQPHCFPCPLSTYSRPGSTSCSDCPLKGPYPNNTRCTACPPGQEYDLFQGVCHPCGIGFYKSLWGYQPCLPCPPNAYSDYGATNCVQCGPNSALMKNGSCASCQPGEYYDSYLRQCHKCDRGSFTSVPNSMQLCHVCAGHSYSFDGASSCVECPPNQALMGNGSCAACAPGYYYDEHLYECEQCPPNHISQGGDITTCQVCPSGSYSRAASTRCFYCPPKTALIVGELDACGTCPPATYYDQTTATCERCTFGFVKSDNGTGICERCGSAFISNEDYTACVHAALE